jgi:hypothetical protein
MSMPTTQTSVSLSGLDMALLSRPGDIGGEDDEGIDENPH